MREGHQVCMRCKMGMGGYQGMGGVPGLHEGYGV